MNEPDLKPHQLLALRKLSNGKILDGGVGTGKSRVAVEYYMLRERPKHVYVITTARKRDDLDWEREFQRVNVGPLDGPSLPDKARRAKHAVGAAGRGRLPRHRTSGISVRGEEHEVGGISSGSGDGGVVQGELTDADRALGEGQRRVKTHVLSGVPGRGKSASEWLSEGARGISEPGTYPWVLKVDSWNNINKYAGVEGAFFIFDEQRLVGSGQWSKSFLRIARRNNWLLLTATPGDTWMDFVPVFIANGFYKNRSEFKREHVVYSNFTKFPKIDRYINQGRLIRQRAQLLVHMPYERHTRRKRVEVELPYDKEALDKVLKDRWNVYTEEPLRDIGEMFQVARRVVNSDPSRLEMVCELWEKHPRLIIFYSFNYELESLRSLKEYYGIAGTGSTRIATPSKHDASSVCESPMDVFDADGLGATKTSTKISPQSESHVIDAGPIANRSLTISGRSWTSHEGVASSDTTRSRISTSPRGMTEWKSEKSSTTSTSSSMRGTTTRTGLSSRHTCQPSATSKDGDRHFCSSSSTTETCSKKSISLSTPMSLHEDTRSSVPTTSIAEWNGHKHEPVPTTDRWLYLVQYTAGAEAWNCTTTDAMIMYSRHYSWKVIEQSEGRIDRMNTPFHDLWYYQFTSNSWIDRAIERAVEAKEVFNVSKYKGLMTG